MEISNLLLKTIGITLDTVFDKSDADVRLHGIENIPQEPVLYVINHFTRMETVFIPYILKKQLNTFPISLAHHSFFSGTFGKIMEKLGAISTKDPDRDRILVSSLLSGEHPVVIFPEGQMIKDKKIVEKGKYLVYNVGIRRPPHTGAARIALISEFYREKVRFLIEQGDHNNIQLIKQHFGIHMDTEELVDRQTWIVPVNITYYPIRARDNAINRFVHRFSKQMSLRVEDELQVEGTMMTQGVDIDIHFGTPLSVKDYLFGKRKMRKLVRGYDLCLEQDLNRLPVMKTIALELMKSYMDSIYGMTTVNHDHIFSYMLSMYPQNRISETDFKNRANLAIENIKHSTEYNFHTTLSQKQTYLSTDDFHSKFDSFMEAASADGLVTIEKDWIIKNSDRFNKLYKFHTIRMDNIVEVLKNEIQPLEGVTKYLRRVMIMPRWYVRRKIRRRFVDHDYSVFLKDYEKFAIPEESKPKNIGRPLLRRRWFSRRGVLLVHGYMAAPEEMRVLADFLYDKGYTVYLVRLRGHGTAPEDLAGRHWNEWYESVNRGYVVMKNTVKKFAIAGFSTGAGLALLQAAHKPGKFSGIISINAPLHLQNIASRLTGAVVAWNNFLGRFKIRKGKMEYVSNDPENPHINYFRNPVTGVAELENLMKAVNERLHEVNTPTLIIQGSNDPIVNPESGLEIFDKIGTNDKLLCRIFAKRHGIVRGKEFEQVANQVLLFLDYVFSKKD